MNPVNLFYKEYPGDGPTIVIIHGLFGSCNNWVTTAQKLSPEYRVIAVDLRNHGRSPHSPEHSLQSMMEDLLQLLTHLQIPQTILLGHSMGGMVAMEFAEKHGKMVRSLAVVDIAPRPYDHTFHENVFLAFHADLSGCESRKEADNLLKSYIQDDAKRSFIMTNLQKERQGYSWRINTEALKNSGYLSDIAFPDRFSYEGPTLFVLGEASPYIMAGDRELIVEKFKNVTIKTIAGAGHSLHHTHGNIFAKILQNFLIKQ